MTKQQTKKCKCGEEFSGYFYKYHPGIYCSMKCQRKFRTYGQNKGKKNPNGSLSKFGPKNGMWNKTSLYASKSAVHEWVIRRLKKPQVCDICKEDKKLELSNMNDHIHLRDLNDYQWICRKCHLIYDNRLKNLKLAPNHIKNNIKI